MPCCPVCLGEGEIDFRDMDAQFAEHLASPPPPLGVVGCDECDGTGVVSPERVADLHAAAVAAVDQFMAALGDPSFAARLAR